MNNWWLILKKQEMTRLWIDNDYVPVTLLKFVEQEIIGYRTMEKDGYEAVILWVGKKELNKERWIKIKYEMVCEFKITDWFIQANEAGKKLDFDVLNNVDSVSITWTSKWKGFQWVIRRYWFHWWPETHGSKFHRRPGSIWNRKPRRVAKWKKLPWHMWVETVTLKNVKIIDRIILDSERLLAVKWSVPGAYNSCLKIVL